MPLRHIEIILPSDQAEAIGALLVEQGVGEPWHESLDDGQAVVRLLLASERTGGIVDAIEHRFGQQQGFRLLITTAEAALPRPVTEEPAPVDAPRPVTRSGLSREELYTDIENMSRQTAIFYATVVLSMIVATVGMMRDNVAVIIGAMVIAPLLGPNVALAFAATLGDAELMKRAMRSNLAGVMIALGLAIVMGALSQLAPAMNATSDEVMSRTAVSLSDIALALAAGSAGALAVTSGVPAALVGVMVAVALLPPTVALGLMIGTGRWEPAMGAGLLLMTNVICINLSGVTTFLIQGVRPLSWWEASRARRSARWAMALWIILLVVLAVIIVWARGR